MLSPPSATGARTPLVVANWKMHQTRASAEAWVRDFGRRLGSTGRGSKSRAVEVMVAPSFVHLVFLTELGREAGFAVAAQDCHPDPEGAFTGSVSAPMIRDAGAVAVLVGHSERRQFLGESDELVRHKLAAARAAGLLPILCIGETLAEREGGDTVAVLDRQLHLALAGGHPGGLVVAYEPIWAIGTGRTASAEQAEEAAEWIRRSLASRAGVAIAEGTRILYGGSVRAESALAVLAGAQLDGALVGGASLEPENFAGIVEAMASRTV